MVEVNKTSPVVVVATPKAFNATPTGRLTRVLSWKAPTAAVAPPAKDTPDCHHTKRLILRDSPRTRGSCGSVPDTFVTDPTPPASTWRSPGARMPRLDAGRGPSPAWADLSHLLYKAATSKELSPSPIRSYEQIEHAILSCERHTPRGWGSTGRGLSVLHEGPTYPEYPQPSPSSTPPSCIAPRQRLAPPGRLRAAETAPSGRAGSTSPVWQTHPTGALRRHDIRNSQEP